MRIEHTFTHNRFFFFFCCFDSHSNTLTPLHFATRIEAAKRHWRAHWACRLTLAHPGLKLVEDHPSRLLSPGCLDQFMTPTRGDRIVDTLESKWLSHGPAPLLPASISSVYLYDSLLPNKFFVTMCNCYAAAIIVHSLLRFQKMCHIWIVNEQLLEKKHISSYCFSFKATKKTDVILCWWLLWLLFPIEKQPFTYISGTLYSTKSIDISEF